ncbi:MAG: transposase [Oscillospiraceae bacterium]|nr:transposase [Oscillospiraceae bacterium]
MDAKEVTQWQDETALERFKLISPLIDPDLDPAKRAKLRLEIAENNGVSERSLFRYEKAYRDGSFAGLKPVSRTSGQTEGPFPGFNDVLEEAILLKREVPTRSVNQIILILEGEGKVKTGLLKRSTLQEHLYKAGFGRRQMRKVAEARKGSSRRFCRPHRMMLAQADIKYVKLPIGRSGRLVQCYICALIDDHSRYILASGIYPDQCGDIVEDVYKKAILSYGIFSATYVDNGSQFISKQLIRALSQLGIRHLRAKPYACQSKGKIEVYNRLVNSFETECKAKGKMTLEDANRYWQYFVEEYYHQKPHAGIAEYYVSMNWEVPDGGITPQQEFNRDSVRLRFMDAGLVANAFLHHETRVVDKGACISFGGKKYDVGVALIGAKVEIVFDPMAPETITVCYQGMEPFEAHPLEMSDYCKPKPKLPDTMLPVEPETSRFLDMLEKKHQQRMRQNADAISFASLRRGSEDDV